LLAHRAPFAIDVVGGADPGSALIALADAHPGQVTVHPLVDDMASLMLNADIAAGAGGSSSWERCVLGLPSALVTTAPNQALNVARLAAAGAAMMIGNSVGFDVDDAAASILALVQDRERLARMSEAAFAICDGKGVQRVASYLTGSAATST